MAKNAPIGRVVATSGKRLKAAGRKMDWALIQVIDDKTRNRPPSPKTSARRNYTVYNLKEARFIMK